jgi:membrane fusion protein (multidrug efflux system)
LQLATVEGGNRVKLKTIVQGRDFGKTVEVLSGISADDEVVVNPPDSLADGAEVRLGAQPGQPNGAPQPAKKT